MMRFVGIGSAAALFIAMAPAQAQTPQTMSASPASTGWSADTPVETLAADPAARAILEKDVPMLLKHPSYQTIKSLNLRQIQPYSAGALTDAMIAAADRDLKALKVR